MEDADFGVDRDCLLFLLVVVVLVNVVAWFSRRASIAAEARERGALVQSAGGDGEQSDASESDGEDKKER
jgi:uncharacterized membrane protein YqiK